MGDPQGPVVTVTRRESWRFPLTTPANYYIISINNIKFLIDSGTEPLNDIEADYILLTHWHWDHTAGITGFRNRVVCASQQTINILSSIDNIMERVLTPLRAMGVNPYEAGGNRSIMKEFFEKIKNTYLNIINIMNKNEVYEFQDCPLPSNLPVEFHPCPGHTMDHYCIRLGDYIFVGDNATIGESPTTIDYQAYLSTVLRILGGKWDYLGPGHGPLQDRSSATNYFNNIITRKNKRLILVASSLQEELSFNDLLYKVYRLPPTPQAYVPARTLIGYLRALEEARVVEIDRSREPWVIAKR
ncbi:MAG: MBL fold metallo-hydrolase [Desulfurococcales archaeon]|nr:MBL fold metallo-hydrolase [Desulfurococcales archaeon]